MRQKEIQAFIDELDEAPDVMRSLASELGGGGYDAPTVTTKVAHDRRVVLDRRVRCGVDQLVESLRQDRKVGAAERLIEAIKLVRGPRCSNMMMSLRCGKCFFCVTDFAIRDFEGAG